MFVLREETEPLHWPVRISRPLSGGKIDKRFGFTAHFRVLPVEQLDKLRRAGDREIIAQILVGWEPDLCDEHSQPLPFSAETRDRLAGIAYIKLAILEAYWEMMSGREAKN